MSCLHPVCLFSEVTSKLCPKSLPEKYFESVSAQKTTYLTCLTKQHAVNKLKLFMMYSVSFEIALPDSPHPISSEKSLDFRRFISPDEISCIFSFKKYYKIIYFFLFLVAACCPNNLVNGFAAAPQPPWLVVTIKMSVCHVCLWMYKYCWFCCTTGDTGRFSQFTFVSLLSISFAVLCTVLHLFNLRF